MMMHSINNLEKAAQLLKDRSNYPDIPSKLIRYLENAKSIGDPKNRFVAALKDASELTIGAIDNLFLLASNATKLSPDDLLRMTDFNVKDQSPERIDSALAEIRTINFLDEEGFTHITPLRASKSRRADISAKRCNYSYSIEVVTSNFYARDRTWDDQIQKWIKSRLIGEQKNVQISNTANEIGNARHVLVCVLDTLGAVALNTHEDYLEMAKSTWHKLENNSNWHICIITGRKALGHGSDNTVFPSWPNVK